MKRRNCFKGLCLYSAIVLAVSVNVSCTKQRMQEGTIRLKFDDGNISALTSRSALSEAMDTNEFILKISGPDGKTVYSGFFGDSPEQLKVAAGSYDISIRSCEFVEPLFDCPQYGDDKCVIVPSGGVVDVVLQCSQINCGMKLNIDTGFKSKYPSGDLSLKCAEGSLPYSYAERRVAYFRPGNISLHMKNGAEDRCLLTRNLLSREMLVINVTASGSSSYGGISVEIDTSRVWTGENYDDEQESDKGGSADNAMTVSQARSSIGAKGVWVGGYVVGGDLKSSTTGISFEAPFSSATNIAIAGRSSVSDKNSCIAVQLPAGRVRDAVNLMGNPDMLGRQVVLKGDIVDAYFGIVGLKNVSDYWVK